MLPCLSPRWLHPLRVVLFFATLTLPVFAQKADATRIEFPRGSSSAVVTGALRGQQQMEYAVGAKRKQVLSLQLYAVPANSLSLQLRSVATDRAMALTASGPTRWKAVLPEDGDYEIWVVREKGRSPESTYRLRVAIH